MGVLKVWVRDIVQARKEVKLEREEEERELQRLIKGRERAVVGAGDGSAGKGVRLAKLRKGCCFYREGRLSGSVKMWG
jgi:hypothetical protein